MQNPPNSGETKYKRMIELGKTMLLVYVNPEPMSSMMILSEEPTAMELC